MKTRNARLIEELRQDNASLREVNTALLWHMNHCPPPCGIAQAKANAPKQPKARTLAQDES